jgi:hypothetical protein
MVAPRLLSTWDEMKDLFRTASATDSENSSSTISIPSGALSPTHLHSAPLGIGDSSSFVRAEWWSSSCIVAPKESYRCSQIPFAAFRNVLMASRTFASSTCSSTFVLSVLQEMLRDGIGEGGERGYPWGGSHPLPLTGPAYTPVYWSIWI